MSAHSTDPVDSSFEVAIEEKDGWARRLTITVPPERVASRRDAERKRLSRSLHIKGFRRGHVPPQVVEQRFGPLLDERAVRGLVEEAYGEAVRRHALHPVGEPSIGNVRYAAGEPLTFQVDLEVMPTLDLRRIGGFRIKRPEVRVSEEEAERLLEGLREEHAVWEPADRSPEPGDLVSVRIAPLEEGAEAGEPKPYRFHLGQGQAIPGVEESIRALRPGEARTFEVEFPGEGGPAGRRRLHVELVGVAARRLPELDDAFASEVASVGGVEQLRAAVREDLRRHHEREAEAAVRDALLDSIIEANSFVVPRAMVDDFLSRALPSGREGVDEAEIERARAAFRPQAEREIRRTLVAEHLIEREGLQATPEEVETRIRALAERQGKHPAEVRHRLEKEDRLVALTRQVAVEKLFDYLKTRSTVE